MPAHASPARQRVLFGRHYEAEHQLCMAYHDAASFGAGSMGGLASVLNVHLNLNKVRKC